MSSENPEALPPIYNLSPPHGAITDDNHGGYVVISSWILMCFFVVCVTTRLATRWSYVMAGGIDDILAGVAMIFGIAQTAVIHKSASSGLGQHQDVLSEQSFDTYAMYYYASNILFVAALLFSKISTIFLLTRLAPKRSTRQICQATAGLFALWALATILSLAFQCQLPRPWDYRENADHHCVINTAALNYSIMVCDILSDLACIVIPGFMLWNLQMAAQRRWTLILAFGCRISVCICSAIRISTLVRYYGTEDKSWEAVAPQTWLQIIQSLSIMSACIPSLKILLGSLDSGFMDLSMKMHGGPTYRTEYGHGTSNSNSKQGTGIRSAKQINNNSFALTSLSKEKHTDSAIHETTHGSNSVDSADRAGSLSESTTHLRQHSLSAEQNFLDDGIVVTREIDVREVHSRDPVQEHEVGSPHYFEYGRRT